MFDEIRARQYELNGMTKTALQFFKGTTPMEKYDGTLSNLIGHELTISLVEFLRSIGVNQIKQEVPIQNTAIDVLAYFNREFNAYECKAVSDLKATKVIKQIRQYTTKYNNTHVYVLKDTCVSRDIHRAIKLEGADILHSDLTKKDLVDRIYRIVNMGVV